MLYLLEELLVGDHLLVWFNHCVSDPVFKVPPNKFDRIEVRGAWRKKENSHS
jgi:hypothetical protein